MFPVQQPEGFKPGRFMQAVASILDKRLTYNALTGKGLLQT